MSLSTNITDQNRIRVGKTPPPAPVPVKVKAPAPVRPIPMSFMSNGEQILLNADKDKVADNFSMLTAHDVKTATTHRFRLPTFHACVACTTPTIVYSYFDCCTKSYVICEACTMQLRYCCPTCFPHSRCH